MRNGARYSGDAGVPQSPSSFRACVLAYASRNDERRECYSGHPEEIALADFHAIVAQNSMRGRGMEIEIRERERGEELLPLQRDGAVGAGREGDVLLIGALELRGLERLDVVDGPGETLPQFLKRLFGVGRGRHLAVRQPRAAFGRE